MIWIIIALLSAPGADAPLFTTGGPFATERECRLALALGNKVIQSDTRFTVIDAKCVSLGGTLA